MYNTHVNVHDRIVCLCSDCVCYMYMCIYTLETEVTEQASPTLSPTGHEVKRGGGEAAEREGNHDRNRGSLSDSHPPLTGTCIHVYN